VKNDIVMSKDQHKAVVLVLVYLYAAFDTVDHSVLFSRLKVTFDLSGNVLDWFKSYLGQQAQRVSVHGFLSDPICLLCGVSQGSVFGPLIFRL
jgi:hypothetical protein